jgi:hypothetical protein
MKMTVLYLKGCGHAMAALTRAALSEEEAPEPDDPDQASPEVVALVGEALPVRGFTNLTTNGRNATQFAIPANMLATLTLERNDDQLLAPRGYAVVEDERLEVPPAAPAPTPEIRGGDASTLYVALTADVVVEQHIMLHVVPLSGASGDGQFCHGIYKPDSATKREVSFSMGAPLHGTYDVLVLMAGRRSAVRQLTVP